MKIKSFFDKASSFLLEPNKQERSPARRRIAWATTITAGILTLGIVQGLSLGWRKIRQNSTEKSPSTETKIFQDVHPSTKKSAHLENEEIKRTPTVNIDSSKTVETTFSDLAERIYTSRDKLWEQSVAEAGKNNAIPFIIFIDLIRTEFRKENVSLSSIHQFPDAFNKLMQSNRIRRAILFYAESSSNTLLKKMHLKHIINQIINNTQNLTQLATKVSEGNKDKINFNLLLIIIKWLEDEGRSFEDVIKDEEILKLFIDNETLKTVLALYIYIRKQNKKEKFAEAKSPTLKEAEFLAKKFKHEPGLVTKLGLKEFEENPQALKRAVKFKLLELHPDKNPNGDPDLVNDATALHNLLNRDGYDHYQQMLKKEREKK